MGRSFLSIISCFLFLFISFPANAGFTNQTLGLTCEGMINGNIGNLDHITDASCLWGGYSCAPLSYRNDVFDPKDYNKDVKFYPDRISYTISCYGNAKGFHTNIVKDIGAQTCNEQIKMHEADFENLNLNFKPSLPMCTETYKGICVESYKRHIDIGGWSPDKLKSDEQIFYTVYLRNTNSFEETFNSTDISVSASVDVYDRYFTPPVHPNPAHCAFSQKVENDYPLTSSFVATKAYVIPPSFGKTAKCEISVSGSHDRFGGAAEPGETVIVRNGEVIIKATLIGARLTHQNAAEFEFSGYTFKETAKQYVVLNTVPYTPITIKAKTMYNSKPVECEISIKSLEILHKVAIQPAGDCNFFNDLRGYYFYKKNRTIWAKTDVQGKVKINGLGSFFGNNGPNVPFRGIYNAAVDNKLQIQWGSAGGVELPTASSRLYSGAILTVHYYNALSRIQSTGNTNTSISEALFYGDINLDKLTSVSLYKTDFPGRDAIMTKLNPQSMIVFRIHLAAATKDANGVDRRGRAGYPNLENYFYSKEVGGTSIPMDYLVPFTDTSCFDLTKVEMPKVNNSNHNESLYNSLKSRSICMVSRTYRYADLINGNITLQPLHLVPELGSHRYPLDFLKTAFKTKSCETTSGTKKPCWNLNKAYMPASHENPPVNTYEQCRIVNLITTTSTSSTQKCSGGFGVSSNPSCSTQTTTTTTVTPVVTYKPACQTLETNPQDECKANSNFRFTGYMMMMAAALGCAKKYDEHPDINNQSTSGLSIAPVLDNQGILPYNTSPGLGGANPKHWSLYPVSPLVTKKGYGCIPCKISGFDDLSSVKVLPYDFEKSDNPRAPIFSFSKGEAPEDCVVKTNFAVRYFGGASCGVGADPETKKSQFCQSSNIAPQNCPTTDGGAGGNVAGSFEIDLCPSSAFAYQSVSVSWSPLLLDIKGKGFQISRSIHDSIKFDIKGDQKPIFIDWPLNTDEVAFLALPNKKGLITSIKELFGDHISSNGFEALSKLDSNRDGMISADDLRYKELKLWFDLNRDGISQKSEIKSLPESGVDFISLNYNKPSPGFEAEMKTLLAPYFNNKDNAFYNIADYYFKQYLERE